jgi:hypothetical protein
MIIPDSLVAYASLCGPEGKVDDADEFGASENKVNTIKH